MLKQFLIRRRLKELKQLHVTIEVCGEKDAFINGHKRSFSLYQMLYQPDQTAFSYFSEKGRSLVIFQFEVKNEEEN